MLSSVADRLYWAGRYLERAENAARLVNVYSNLLLDLPVDAGVSWLQLIRISGSEQSFAKPSAPSRLERRVVEFMTAANTSSTSILTSLASARQNVRTLRDVIPREAFEAVNELFLYGGRHLMLAAARRRRNSVLTDVIKRCQQINGLIAGTMSHGSAYEFLVIGRLLERADMTTRIVDVAGELSTSSPETYAAYETLLWVNVLQSLSAYQMYRQSVRSRITPLRVMHFVVNDTQFPRALAYCLNTLADSFRRLPNHDRPLASVNAMVSHVAGIGARDLAGERLHTHIDDFQLALIDVHAAIDSAWFAPHREGTELVC